MSRLPNRGPKARTKQKIRVRIARPWRGYPVGAVIQPPGTLRSVLVNHGIAEIVDESVAADEPVIVEAAEETETDIVTDRDEIEKPKRRGRPRKADKTED